MSTLSIFRKAYSHRFSVVLVWLIAFASSAAYGIDPNWSMSQYIHDRWGPEQGFAWGQVHAVTQTSDGYLWIGTEVGLIRFDGVKFQRIEDDTKTFAVTSVLGLASASDGSLWMILQSPEVLVRYWHGRFDNPLSVSNWGYSAVTSISRTGHGDLLAYRSSPGAIAYRAGTFETLADTSALPRSPVLSIAQTGDGDIWMGTRDSGLFRFSGGRSSIVAAGLPDPKVDSLLPEGNHGLWIGTDNGLAHWDGHEIRPSPIAEAQSRFQVLAMTRDRDSNLWIGTDSQGVIRVNGRGVAILHEGTQDTANAVTAVFEDREGNIWIGSTRGIERLRDSAFLTYSTAEGMPSPSNGPVFVDSENRTWFAPIGGGLYWLDKGKVNRLILPGLKDEVAYSIAGAADELWIGWQRGGLTRLRFSGKSPVAKTFTTADGLAQNSVCSVYIDSNGSVWAGTLSNGVSRLDRGKFTSFTAATGGLASDTVFSISSTPDGTIWFATPTGLSALSGERWRTYRAGDGLPADNVNCLFRDSKGVLWIGTTAGLVAFRQGKVQRPQGTTSALNEQVLGVAEDHNGALWIATSNHVLRVNRGKLLDGPLTGADVRQYGTTDGLQSTRGVRRQQSVFADSLGRVWFSLNRGLSLVDSLRATGTAMPIIAQIQSLQADGQPVDLRGPVRVPTGRRRIAFDYAGLYLSDPERVRFRYALDGYDPRWSTPSQSREAAYTNLGPGSYRFRVIASNDEGLWNSPEVSLPFEIETALWQTYWFRICCLLACALLIAAAYRFRVHQMTSRLNLMFEERLLERSRIAQELHDTLLQGLLSASIQLHVASEAVPPGSAAKPRLNRVQELMAQVIEDGRNAVRGLRSSASASLDLEQAFSLIKEELSVPDDVNFRVIIRGQPRALNPILRDESYRIGREALVNAFRHSQASAVDAEVEYSQTQLLLVVSDNGCGIDKQVLESGREGHWGLLGMRERAERVGGTLNVRSSAFSGTEVRLSVPSRIAFVSQPFTGRWGIPFRLPRAWLRAASRSSKYGEKHE